MVIVEPLSWRQELASFSGRWPLWANWACGAAMLLCFIPAFLHTLWWLLLAPVFGITAHWIFCTLEDWRLRPVYRAVEEQLTRRGNILDELWPGDPSRRQAAQQIADRSPWRHKVFAPDDPLWIVLHDATSDDNDQAMLAAEEILGQRISYEYSEELMGMTFGEAVDRLLSKKGATHHAPPAHSGESLR